MLRKDTLAFIDVETTGCNPKWDRVIEIGIIRVENGKITARINTLLNPERHVSPFIESLTGINADQLTSAPFFSELKDKIYDLLDGAIFVAHNAMFDYNFIRSEFKRIGLHYSAKTLCTVRLSRLLFPHHKSHNLTSIIERYQLHCKNRHRAYDDAYVLHQFIKKVQKKVSTKQYEEAVKTIMKNTYAEDKRFSQVIDELPESPGVYIFYGNSEIPYYVGKSTNIKERVKNHFKPSYESPREYEMIKGLSRIEYIRTAGELGALLKESVLIKELQPIYNRKLRKSHNFLVAQRQTDLEGYETVQLKTIESFEEVPFDTVLGIFKNKRAARITIAEIAKKYGLCNKILGLEKTGKACFEYQLKRCKGACMGLEECRSYNNRFLIAFLENKQFRPWSFRGPIEIVEKNDHDGLFESFIVDRWCIIGKREQDEHINMLPVNFDLDSYKILSSYIKYKKANFRTIDMISTLPTS